MRNSWQDAKSGSSGKDATFETVACFLSYEQ